MSLREALIAIGAFFILGMLFARLVRAAPSLEPKAPPCATGLYHAL